MNMLSTLLLFVVLSGLFAAAADTADTMPTGITSRDKPAVGALRSRRPAELGGPHHAKPGRLRPVGGYPRERTRVWRWVVGIMRGPAQDAIAQLLRIWTASRGYSHAGHQVLPSTLTYHEKGWSEERPGPRNICCFRNVQRLQLKIWCESTP